jgi:hypothetical protein
LSTERDAPGDRPGGDVAPAPAAAPGNLGSRDARRRQPRPDGPHERPAPAAPAAAPGPQRRGPDADASRSRPDGPRDQPRQPPGSRDPRLPRQQHR